MLDPPEDLFSYTLLDDATVVHKTGRRASAVGREAIEVLVATISWGYRPAIFYDYRASMKGTTDHLLLVDGKTGALLHVAAGLDGWEFRVAEIEEDLLQRRVRGGHMLLELPGVEFERWYLPDYEKRRR